MIPLIRPIIPSSFAALLAFERSQAAGQYSNFGPVHDEVTERLEYVIGGYCVPASSGTTALEAALRSSDLPPGAGVLIPDFTHVGTMLAVVRAGLLPVLCKVNPETWVLDIADAEAAWERGVVQAVIVVSPFGYQTDILPWEMWQDRSGVAVFYDFAGAWGNVPRTPNPVIFSFHATKNFGIGEGGVASFGNQDQRNRAKRLLNFDTQLDRTIYTPFGMNGKMDELHCSYLLAGLSDDHQAKVKERIKRHERLMYWYRHDIKGSSAPSGIHHPSLVVLQGLPAADLEEASEALGITFKRYYPLISRMKVAQEMEVFSVSEPIMETCLALPCDVTDDEAREVIDVIKDWSKPL